MLANAQNVGDEPSTTNSQSNDQVPTVEPVEDTNEEELRHDSNVEMNADHAEDPIQLQDESMDDEDKTSMSSIYDEHPESERNDELLLEETEIDDELSLLSKEIPANVCIFHQEDALYALQSSVESSVPDPTSFSEAIYGPHKKEWELSMKDELKSIEDNSTWVLVELPKGRKAIGLKWVYKTKRDVNDM